MTLQKIYSAFLFASAAIVWTLLILARFAEYDMNYGFAIFALLASVFVTFTIPLVWWLERGIVKNSVFSTIAFLVMSSPISICLFVIIFTEFVGQYFKL